MKERILGRTGWSISEVGFGGWGIGKKWWGAVDDNASREALAAAWKQRINFYDTAYIYGDGHSEELMGAALKSKPAIIATKIPPKNDEWPANPKTDVKNVFPAEWIISCTERSLKKLKRDTIDLTQLHVWTDAWVNNDEWKTAVQKLKQQGKIRAFGVSINDHDPHSALKLVASGLIDTVQVIFNIFDQSPVEELFPLCQKHRVGVIVRVPYDEGGLTGTLTLKTKFEKGDFRGQYFRGDNLRQTVERVERLKQYLDADSPTIPHLALKFILSHEAVSVVIPGMRQVKHVDANVKIAESAPLSNKVLQALRGEAWNRNFYGWWD